MMDWIGNPMSRILLITPCRAAWSATLPASNVSLSERKMVKSKNKSAQIWIKFAFQLDLVWDRMAKLIPRAFGLQGGNEVRPESGWIIIPFVK
jgi:hypothetical protein